MPGKEVLQPLPCSYIVDWQDRQNLRETFAPYVWQAVTALRIQWRDFPKDVYAIGDNWALMICGREIPTNKGERKYARENPDYLFADTYQIQPRADGNLQQVFGIEDYLRGLMEDAEFGEVPERILEKIAILDRTSPGGFFAIFNESKVGVVRRYPWGRKLRVEGYDTLIYHIQNEVRPKLRIHVSSPDA